VPMRMPRSGPSRKTDPNRHKHELHPAACIRPLASAPRPALISPGPMTRYNQTHLKLLEAESIHIIREVAAEFQNPVMLYSIGKDSAVMVRLAQKAFSPGRLPFPLMHVNTTWKFKEMVRFRDQFCKENGFELIEHINKYGLD